ncbi:MAG: OmpW family protein [Gemmatimonadales bacterium]
MVLGARALVVHVLVLAASLGCGRLVLAQETASAPYRVKVRATMSGSSDVSDAGSYAIYSGIALDVALARSVGPFALELALRTESREVTDPGAAGAALGSLEMLPVTLSAQWRPLSGRAGAFQPYVGAGVSSTVTWEKSGALDSVPVPMHVGPLLQLGFDRRLSPASALNLDVRWSTLRVDLSAYDAGAQSVKVDPLVLGLGLSFGL